MAKSGFGNQRAAGFSTPWGKGGIGDDPGGWFTGKTAFNDLTGVMAPVQNQFQAQTYQADPNAFKIGNESTQQFDAMGQAAQGRDAASMQAAQINMGPQNQVRGQQSQLGSMLMQQAQGQGPSVAQLQLQRGLGQAIASQRAQAASARGISPGLAQRLASQGIAQAQSQTNADAAQLRAGEMMQARGALGSMLAGQRGQDQGIAAQQAGLQQGANQANLGASMQQQGMNDQMTQYYTSQGFSRDQAAQMAAAQLQQLNADQQTSANSLNQATAEENAKRQQTAQGGMISAIGTGLGGILKSDRTAKTDIKGADEETEEMLDGLGSYLYRYKKESDGHGKHLGIMAQDMAKSRMGREIVGRLPDGDLGLDGKKTLGALLAASANLNKRVRQMEASRG
jgi:hypothetical protein